MGARRMLMAVNVGRSELRYLFLLMQPAKLEIEKLPVSTETVAVYQAKGKLGLETVSEFVQRFRPDPTPQIILDMSGITFLDSAGVGSLVSLFVSRRNQGKTFALSGLTAQGSAVVTVAGLQNLLPIYKTIDEAMTAKKA
jgi:anti-sigma B factor antagonist